MRWLLFFSFFTLSKVGNTQLVWQKIDTFNLPNSIEVFYTNSKIDTNANIAYYIKINVADKKLLFETDTTQHRRLTPQQFYAKNNNPLVVVNSTFFSFEKNQNLNVVINNKKLLSHNIPFVSRKNKNGTSQNIAVYRSAIGITQKRRMDVAWIKTDTNHKLAKAIQEPITATTSPKFKKWKMQTAVGGGPSLLREGKIEITNEFEQMFAGKKGLEDKHPRTAMGYTADGYLIIIVVQGRTPGVATGVSLVTLATIMQKLGCVEALNLDGGGSSCMLLNGKNTITPSDKTGQRAVPAVFLIKTQ